MFYIKSMMLKWHWPCLSSTFGFLNAIDIKLMKLWSIISPFAKVKLFSCFFLQVLQIPQFKPCFAKGYCNYRNIALSDRRNHSCTIIHYRNIYIYSRCRVEYMTINDDLSPDHHIDVTTVQICNGHILIDTPGVTFDLNEQIISYNPFLSTSEASPQHDTVSSNTSEYPRVP